MKKFSIFALVLALTLALSACGRRNTDTTTDTTATTGNTMPTVITTMPEMEDDIPGTSFHPDQDGLIGETDGTDGTDTTGTTETTGPDARMRLR